MKPRGTWGRWMALAIVLAALMAAVPAWAQDGSAIGPYIQNVGKDNATICWATPLGQVSLSPPTEERDTAFREYQFHSVLLRNLKPGMTYTYDVLGDGTGLGKGSFATVPDGDQPFSFIVIGDTQNRDQAAHPRIVERIIAEMPDLVVNTGDLTSEGRDIVEWEYFFRINHDLMRDIPYYTVLGNHEKHSRLYFDFFSLPGREEYYSFNRGPAHFVVLDTPGLVPPEDNQAVTNEQREAFAQQREQYWQTQMAWFKQDLAGSQDAKYVFVFFHYPVYTMLGRTVEGAQQTRELFGSVFQDHHVSATFSGHDHIYCRAAAGGVQYVVQGVAGGNPRPTDAKPVPEMVKWASKVTYVRVDVGPDRARVHVTDVEGQPVDSFEVMPRQRPAAAQ